MRFEVRSELPCSPEEVWAILESPEYDARMARESTSTREIVERRHEGGVLYTRRRISLSREIPGPMKKVIGSDRITYDQENWLPDGGDTLRWKITPMMGADRFHGEGTTRVVPTQGGSERIIHGELQIRVPLLGGKMEKKLVDDVVASYEKAAVIIRQILAERG
jgi:hypothetical protein